MEGAHPAATSHACGEASLAPLPHAGGGGGGPEPAPETTKFSTPARGDEAEHSMKLKHATRAKIEKIGAILPGPASGCRVRFLPKM